MMRLTMAVWWSLALVWFLTSQVDAEPASAQAARHIDVKGYGQTVEAAKRNAIEEAIQKVRAHLQQQHIDHWQPTESYVVAHLLDGPGHADSDIPIEGLGKAKTWVYALKIPGDDTLQRMDRHAKRRSVAQERVRLALGMIALLVLGLGLVIGGIRTDEWTHARYTTWIRLAGGSLLAALTAGWWWLSG